MPSSRPLGTTNLAVMPTGRVVRYSVDQVGNDLTCVLRWCETHVQPVWVYGDGSYECPHTLVVQHDTKDHVIVEAPWERPAGHPLAGAPEETP